MLSQENKNYRLFADLSEDKQGNLKLEIFVFHKGLKIICDKFTFEQPNDKESYHLGRLNEFIAFLDKIEEKYDVYDLVLISQVELLFNDIEVGYFTRYDIETKLTF